jgi:hypothetical protein
MRYTWCYLYSEGTIANAMAILLPAKRHIIFDKFFRATITMTTKLEADPRIKGCHFPLRHLRARRTRWYYLFYIHLTIIVSSDGLKSVLFRSWVLFRGQQ